MPKQSRHSTFHSAIKWDISDVIEKWCPWKKKGSPTNNRKKSLYVNMGKADHEYLIFCQCSTEDKNNASLQVRTSLWNQGKSYSVLSDFPWSRAFLLNCIIFYLNVRIWLSAAGVGWWLRLFTACGDQVKAVSSATNRIWLNLETKGHCKKIYNNNTDNTT